MRSNFIELARICIAHSRVRTSPRGSQLSLKERIRKKAADLEWENWLC